MNTAANFSTVKRGSVPVVHFDLPDDFGSNNLLGYVCRIRAVARANGVDLSYLNALAEQQRREGRAS
jgi:hypothetical protein